MTGRATGSSPLRDLDLARRLFRHPCSYLIYSESFDELPRPAKDQVYRRLWAVLTGEDRNEVFGYVSTGIFDREAANSRHEFNEPGGAGILKSTDAGATWVGINDGLGRVTLQVSIWGAIM